MTTPARPGVVLRSARPDVSDGIAFARLLDQAQEGWFRIALGRRAESVVAASFPATGHELSHVHVLMAESDGAVIGMASGYTAEARGTFTKEPIEAAAGDGRRRYRAISRLSRRMTRFMDDIPDRDFYVRAIAVDPDYRNKGVGGLLMNRMIDNAKACGAKRLVLDVAAKNRNGRRFYERIGMTRDSESRRWFGLPNTNVIRITLPL
jgi:ribosomal protein S18 acetylase RimI-like enzyme